MGRGFLSGIFWGGIVSLALLFVADQTVERQSLSFPNPEAVAVEVPGGSEFNQAREETDPVVPEADARPQGDNVAGVAVPEEPGDAPPVFDTSALEVPVPSTTQDAPETLGEAPEAVTDVPDPSTAVDTAVTENAGEALTQPESPGVAPAADTANVAVPEAELATDDAPKVASEADAAPVEAETEIASAPAVETAPDAPVSDAAPQVTSQVDAPGGPAAPAVETDAPLPREVGDADTALDEAPAAPSLPEIASEPSLPPVGTDDVQEAPEIAAVEPEEQPLPSFMVDLAEANRANEAANAAAAEENDRSDDAPMPVPEADGTETADAGEDGSILQPVATLTDESSNLVTDREPSSDDASSLPVVRRFGDSSTEQEEEQDLDLLEEETSPAPGAAPEASEPSVSGPALSAFSSAFVAPDGVPLMSIVLVHQGDAALSPDVLEALDPQIGFAVDASEPNASEIAAAYRAAGREVVMIPALPAGAAPQDIEQALTVNFERIPEAVAVMDVSGSSFQSDRDAVAQVVDVVSGSGHGLITFPRGLNTAHQEAQRAGVPTGLIFRNLDGKGETQEQIRRGLDRAAFRARQDEAVILVATTGSNTLSALTEWALGNRAETVAIAPVSVALGD